MLNTSRDERRNTTRNPGSRGESAPARRVQRAALLHPLMRVEAAHLVASQAVDADAETGARGRQQETQAEARRV